MGVQKDLPSNPQPPSSQLPLPRKHKSSSLKPVPTPKDSLLFK